MSFESDLADALIVHIDASISGVTSRNALTQGFIAENEIGSNEFPHAQVFGITADAAAGDFGQEEALFDVNCRILRDPNQGELLWLDIEAVRLAVLMDYSLGGTVNRAFLGGYGVDETNNRERTLGAILFQVLVVR